MADVQRVMILQTDRPRPSYHRLVNVVTDTDDRDYVDIMACGQRRNQRLSWFTAWLRREHADLFAQPCRRCFPG